MKRILLALMFLASAISPALATNCSSYPYTLTNGSTADANQVMANFNLILNCANNNLAHNGANGDITSLTGLSTPLSVGQGGTGNTSAASEQSRLGLGAAAYEALGNNVVDDGSGNLTVVHGAEICTSSCTVTAPTGVVTSTMFQIVAGGGGGGGGGSSSSIGNSGGGGGSGGVGVGYFTGLTASGTITVVIGASGTAGNSSGSNGGAGGSTTVTVGGQAIITATGGSGGVGGATGGIEIGGAPGSATVTAGSSGLTLAAGYAGAASGGGAVYGGATSGFGGSNAYGSGGYTVQGDTVGVAGLNGGGGGGAGTQSSGHAGGLGGKGFVLITW